MCVDAYLVSRGRSLLLLWTSRVLHTYRGGLVPTLPNIPEKSHKLHFGFISIGTYQPIGKLITKKGNAILKLNQTN